MFVLTLDKSKLKNKKIIIMILSVVISVILTLIIIGIKSKNYSYINGKSFNNTVKGKEDIIRLADFFNIEINESGIDSEKIILPVKFNQIYENYNRLQKNIGCDLSEYRGKECVKYSAEIINDNEDYETIMTILVCNEHFIGGDISSTDYNGKIISLNGAE